MRTTILAALAAASLAGARAEAEPAESSIRVERIGGDPVVATRMTSIADGQVTLLLPPGEHKLPLAEVIEIVFPTPPDPPPAWTPADVAADLATGETLHGQIRGGDAHGLRIASPLLGDVVVPIDRLHAIRFLRRLSQMPEPPDLRAPDTTDVVHLLGGDRMNCTVDSFTERGVQVESGSGEKSTVAYDRVTALRVLGDAGPRPAGTLLVVVLRDGTELIGASPAAADGRIKMKSVAGFAVDVALTDVVAAHVLSDRFAYLSDVPAAKTEIAPFWKPVAGDPGVLYAPRADRSFGGRPLKCGGRSWVKGLGVYSGTTQTWSLDGKYAEFRGSVGLDDGAGPLGGVVFEVLVDGKSRWKSEFVRGAGGEGRGTPGPVAVPRIDLKGASTLTLRVLSGDPEDPWPIADEADWLGAMLVR
jgi:NPCBM/NEW2 domain-containing protein